MTRRTVRKVGRGDVNEVRMPGPLVKLSCERLLKMLFLLDPESVEQGEVQVIRLKTEMGDAVFRVQIERPKTTTFKTLTSSGG